jgi:hypothetical protein
VLPAAVNPPGVDLNRPISIAWSRSRIPLLAHAPSAWAHLLAAYAPGTRPDRQSASHPRSLTALAH